MADVPHTQRFPAPGRDPGPRESGDGLPISEAAERIDTTARMLRYRESLGLLPVTKEQPSGRGHRHRRFTEEDLSTIAAGLELEHNYGISPAALSFALRMLAEPTTLARVRAYGERLGRLAPPPARAMDFEKQKALRLLQQRGQGR
ncbi:DNA-binding transcriptional MerR regulator [Lipingzhangella halophila]|uniref:DNA-binding transcriptional MerR regulator n=1 Tax=Lipingzhangella halophila TaxID=1783352 RepID=A0A7W7W5J1_9ACTN|nr:MerR family transcriptional regulator [Lipingzhangella halophila]MBB4933899.1 DNA-binding transcriptional MerR regulator [Lipingzhangella halophila]